MTPAERYAAAASHDAETKGMWAEFTADIPPAQSRVVESDSGGTVFTRLADNSVVNTTVFDRMTVGAAARPPGYVVVAPPTNSTVIPVTPPPRAGSGCLPYGVLALAAALLLGGSGLFTHYVVDNPVFVTPVKPVNPPVVPTPQNPPVHVPSPPPPPVPKGRVNIGIFYDPAVAAQEKAVAAVKADATLPGRLAALDAEWYLDDVATAKRLGIDKYFGSVTPPVLVVQPVDKPAAILSYPAPATPDGVVAVLKSVRGVK